MRNRVFRLRISREQEKVILLRYPGIKFFLEKMINNTTEKILIEEGEFDTKRELKEYHNRRVLNGYDIHKRKCTQATKDKISKALLAISKRQGWKGMKLLPETIAKMKGHIVTQETRAKISKKNKGQKRTEEQRKNLSKGHLGMTYKKRQIKVN